MALQHPPRAAGAMDENVDGPWWEVDLGREYPIDSVVIHNAPGDAARASVTPSAHQRHAYIHGSSALGP